MQMEIGIESRIGPRLTLPNNRKSTNAHELQARDRIESMAALDEAARSWRRADKQLAEQRSKAAGQGPGKGTRRLLQV
jgi:hypothetical protein